MHIQECILDSSKVIGVDWIRTVICEVINSLSYHLAACIMCSTDNIQIVGLNDKGVHD
jgi:hypothetical protein